MSLTSLGVNSQLKAVAITSILKTTKKMRLQWGLYLSHNLPTFWKLSLKVTILKPLCELPVRPSFFFFFVSHNLMQSAYCAILKVKHRWQPSV